MERGISVPSRVRILAEAVANRIAAGEVVERPASAVKELLENALDAGATSIRIEVEAGGKRMIRVVDDGCGMIHDDALLAFERHATSKLRTSDDLLAISTLGFRGEALPSIASVSRLLLETCAAEETQGTRIEFAGGKLVGVKSAGLPVGTSVSVADLFYCVPARRKFLRSDTTELGHIASLVTHYALAHPGKQFTLKTPTQEIVSVPPVGTMAERVYQLFGRQALDEMVEVPEVSAPIRAAITETELDEAGRASQISVRGFISRPRCSAPIATGFLCLSTGGWCATGCCCMRSTKRTATFYPPMYFPWCCCSSICRAQRWTSTCIPQRSRCASGTRNSCTTLHGTRCARPWDARGPFPVFRA